MLLLSVVLLTGLPLAVRAVSYTGPGVMIDYQPLNYSLFATAPDVFISDPEIIVLTNGDYIASHALAGSKSGSGTSGQTTIYRSTNKGTNWTSLGTYSGILRASLFVQDGTLYLLGANDDTDGMPTVLMQSLDNGVTWPNSAQFAVGGPASPNNPVVWSNRVWIATGTSDLSASTSSNLLNAASWRSTGGFPASSADWLTGTAFIGEGQMVASPQLGTFILPKISDNAYTAVARVSLAGSVTFDPTNNFAPLPGAEKKFGAAYDAGSGKFFILSNPVLPADAGSGIAYNMIRNTAAVLTSRDLFNWKVEKIFIYSTDVSHDGFGYLNFDFDDTNLVVAARTAFKIGTGDDPTRGHDSNVLTFHRLNDFRNLVPDQYLLISGNQVLRYERTAYQNAPLGSFTLGSTFAGTALTAPNGIGKTADGDVYIRETGGRILHFDPLGNFIETNSLAPVAFSASQINATPPPAGECAWMRSGSGDWSDLLNWYYWGRPDTTEEIAVFGSAATAAATINLTDETQIWNFNTAGYMEGWSVANASNTVASGGWLQGDANTNNAAVQIYRTDRFFYGSTVPEVRIRLKADTNCTVYFYWGTTVADAFAAARRIIQSYTNNGAFQDFVFSMAGNTNWDGQAITRLRFDPQVHTNATRGFAVDSITVPKESCRVKGLRFRNATAYTLSGGGNLRLAPDAGNGLVDVLTGGHTVAVALGLATNADFILASGTTLNISGALSGDGGLAKLGAGVMTLSSTNNSYAGDTSVGDGSLKLGAAEVIPNGSGAGNVVVTGTLNLNGKSETINGLSGAGIVDGSSGTPTLTVGDNNAGSVFSGVIQDTAGSLSLAKIGPGTLTLAGTNTYSGNTVITGGSLSVAADSGLGAVPGAATPGKLNLDGGALAATANFALNSKRGIALGATGGMIDVAAATTLTYGGIAAGAGGLTKTGAGALTLSGINTFSGDMTVSAGALQLGGANVLGGGTVLLNGGQLSSDGVTARLLLNDVALMATGAELGDATNSGRLTLAGLVNLGGTTAGTRNLTNASKVVISGPVTNAAASGTLTWNKYGVGDLVIATNGGSFSHNTAANALVHEGALIVDGTTLTILGATVQVKGDVAGSLVRLVVTNGGALLTTNGSGVNWRAGVSGGSPTATNIFEIAGVVSGIHSSYTATANRLLLGDGGTIGIANLWPGGDLTVRNIQKGGTVAAANSEFNFRGGIVRAFANDTGFISTLTNCYVGGGGGGIDSAGFNLTIPQALKDGGGAGYGSGGLTKLGAGKLTLSGTNTYTGNTMVSGGTLALTAPAGATSVLSNSPVITVEGGATLDVSGITSGFRLLSGQTLNGNGGVTGVVTVASGATIAPGNSIGALTFSNSPVLQGKLMMEINKTNSPLTSDQLMVIGWPLTNGGVLTVTNLGPALTGGEVFALLNAAGYSGNFSATNLPALTGTNLNWWLGNLTTNGSLVVNRAPVVTNASYLRVKGTTLKINIANLLTSFASDADGNGLVLQGVGGSGQGATITNDASYITYRPATGATSNASDSFSYTVNDGRGGVRTANINISVVSPTSFTGITNSAGANFKLGFTGVLGYDYVLQRSSNLVQWAGVFTNALPAGSGNTGLIWFTDTPPHVPAYYRTALP